MKIENDHIVIQLTDSIIKIPVDQHHTDRYAHVFKVPAEYRKNSIFVSYSEKQQATEYPACDSSKVEYIGFLIVKASAQAQLMQAKQDKIKTINAYCDAEIHSISESYPETEVLSWPQQVKEADEVLKDPSAKTPLITALAELRGISVTELAKLVQEKSTTFAIITGQIIGKRQLLEQKALSAKSLDEMDTVKW